MLPSLWVMLLLSMLPEFDVLLGEVLSELLGRRDGPRVRESKLPGFMEPSVALGAVVLVPGAMAPVELGEVVSRVREGMVEGLPVVSFGASSEPADGVVRSAGFWVGVPVVPGVASEGVVDCA
ncbi:hypothetical protein [Methylibium sp.]|uniref:hypothetical protein n=1 Tax=Methylibium sp. TaxID=2067992 RepID=UPI00286BB761|nr:hypothetical protein [Methylibium sp.]